jgi:hypothetical protein
MDGPELVDTATGVAAGRAADAAVALGAVTAVTLGEAAGVEVAAVDVGAVLA